MKKLLLLLGTAVFAVQAAQAMEESVDIAQVHKGLHNLWLDTANMTPGTFKVEVAPEWHRLMSFLKRYMQRNFNTADIYDDVVYFNECVHSTGLYKLTYVQIKYLFSMVPQVLEKVAMPKNQYEKDPQHTLKKECLQLLEQVQKFNIANPEYKALWENRNWQQIREAIKQGAK